MLFSNRDLKKLILPLLVEQLLAVSVGMIDIIMVSSVGETAVSGVSLVDTIGVLIIYMLSALATGGAVISAQHLGRKDNDGANMAANQLLLSTTVLSIVIMAAALLARRPLLNLIFGNVEPAIMQDALTYFQITALSYPFLAIYNSCAALYRSMGNSKVSMKTSILMNGINIVGNAICVYGLHMGVAGVAWPTLLSRAVAALCMLLLIKNPQNTIHIDEHFRLGFHSAVIRKIFSIGIPNGLENAMFQLGKILVASLIATFGTTAIAANAVSNTVATFQIIPGSAIGLAVITVVGQCAGAGDYQQARHYTKKLLKVTHLGLLGLNLLIVLVMPFILKLYSLSSATGELARQILVFHAVACTVIWPSAFILPNALRASSDIKFTMVTSILSMWLCRIAMSYVLGKYLGLGVFGVWVAMVLDWVVRAICFWVRYRGAKWQHQV